MKPSSELVNKKIKVYWPNDFDAVKSQLHTLKNKDSTEEGLARVQLAVLKLSAGDRERLTKYIEAALQDWRDVLAWAEYPMQMKSKPLTHFNLTKDEQKEAKAIRKADCEQYEAWLNN